MEWNGYEARQTPNYVDLKVHNVQEHFDLSFWSNTDQ